MDYKVIKTGDESTTLYVPELDETYHSIHGAINESRYVFIRNGLRYWISENREKHVFVLEIGFGTGLNTLLTIQEAEKFKININYISLEPNPLSDRILSEINHADRLGGNRFTSWFEAIHKTEWNAWCEIDKNFRLKKVKASLQDVEFGDDSFDIIYFDAFAPNKQPDLWTIDLIGKTVTTMNQGGIWVTYSAKGQLKRDLKTLGLKVESLPGPPGKNEMVRAVKY